MIACESALSCGQAHHRPHFSIVLTKAPSSLLEYAIYISARKKLIHAVSLDIDRPINRAMVVREH